MTIKIEQAEFQFAQKLSTPLADVLRDLQYSIPEKHRVRISLLDANGRKKRSSASADNWSPESGRIEISFEPGAFENKSAVSNAQLASSSAVRQDPPPVQPHSSEYIHPSETDLMESLLKTLDRAESRPGWSFVPLRKFRDEILVSEHIPSMRTELERQSVLRSAIEKRLVLVGKVPNPRAPEFPVTTIRLNRLMPEVQHLIGQSGSANVDFHPVEIRGEPLSTTILRERR
jgi:hypothetical protein